MTENGLQNFAMHGGDARFRHVLEDLSVVAPPTLEADAVDPETVARGYLAELLAGPDRPIPTENVEYLVIGTETMALTGTRVVKFAQYYHRIPVYGSLVTVELDADNSVLAISTSVGMPGDVDPVATISPAQALAAIGESGSSTAPPKLYFYFDDRANAPQWRLVYIATDIPHAAGAEPSAVAPDLSDYVIDAHDGTLVARLPRTQSITWTPAETTATDGLDHVRAINVERDENGNERLVDTVRNVHTHDFGFRNVRLHDDLLPGELVTNPPGPWNEAAISAHANAADVADYLLTVLLRNGLDNRGGPFISSVNCTYALEDDPTNRVWRNAAWIGTQMVYGQRLVGGELRSYALAGDVVAHEITHGLTESTARLEYRAETGALNESYSDIFGILISNSDQPDVADWNWEMGEDLDEGGIPLRDVSDPGRYGQPAHMDDFRVLHAGEIAGPVNDNGWVHFNSGIHNKAAYNLLNARDPDGVTVFSPNEVAAVYYIALAQYLSRTSLFRDSLQGILLAVRTLGRMDPVERTAARLAAVSDAFAAVGITEVVRADSLA